MIRGLIARMSKSMAGALAAGGMAMAMLGGAAPASAQGSEPDQVLVCQQDTGGGYTFRYVLHYDFGGYLTLLTRDRYGTQVVGEMELIASDFERGYLFELDDRFWVLVNYGRAMISSTRGTWFCEEE